MEIKMKTKNRIINVAMSILLAGIIAVAPMPIVAYDTGGQETYVIPYIDISDLEIVDDFGLLSQIDLLMLECDYFAAEFMDAVYIMNLQARAVDAYGLLMDNFFTMVDGYLKLVYPDNYAGAYIEGDMLVIRLTDTSDEATMFYVNLLGDLADTVTFEQVSFSKNQLTTFGEIFAYEIDAPLVQLGVDTMANAFSIILDTNYAYSAQIVDSFNTNARFMPIPIQFGLGHPVELTSSLTGGSGLGYAPGWRDFSAAATGRRIVQFSQQGYALLTTGHAFIGLSPGTRVYSGTVHIGNLAVFRVGPFHGGSPNTLGGDWAIITLNANGVARMTNNLRTGGVLRGYATAPLNTRVHGVGTHRILYGQVINVNHQIVLTGQTQRITGITIARRLGNAPVVGDSGGTVYTSVNGQQRLAGVIVGGGHYDTPYENTWFFSPTVWAAQHFELILQ